jgi:hypothetical protein
VDRGARDVLRHLERDELRAARRECPVASLDVNVVPGVRCQEWLGITSVTHDEAVLARAGHRAVCSFGQAASPVATRADDRICVEVQVSEEVPLWSTPARRTLRVPTASGSTTAAALRARARTMLRLCPADPSSERSFTNVKAVPAHTRVQLCAITSRPEWSDAVAAPRTVRAASETALCRAELGCP